MSRARSLALVPLAIAVLFLPACGDDGDGTSSDTTAAAPPGETTTSSESDETTASVESVAIPDACTLVEPSEVEALVGPAEQEAEIDVALDGLDYSQCTWEGDVGLFIVAVVEGPDRYETHTANLSGDPVDGIGDEAITAGGVSSETRGATGGRTISALVGGNTLVVALKVDGQTSLEMVAPIATTVAERLVG